MKTIKTKDAVGMVLGHDLTQIIRGDYKGPRFKKGHIVKKEDIDVLLSMGKENIYILELDKNTIHEDDAAFRISRAIAGDGIIFSEPKEGKIELKAAYDGLIKINIDLLDEVNDQPEVMCATIHTNQLVKKGDVLAGTRVIPLTVSESIVHLVELTCEEKSVVNVLPLKPCDVGIVTTGSEIFSGITKDAFGPVLEKKFGDLGCKVVKQILASDEEERIVKAIMTLVDDGVGLIAVTGGMSVDPDDRTPLSIAKAGATIVTYGAPVLPGAMFLLGYINNIPIVGLPGCVMYHGASIFDLVIPRLLAGEKPTRRELQRLAHGGLCRNCEVCVYPMCSFGK
ncbi:MAG: molybdopterin-binding protein [Eubacteriaceae bacterium]